MILDSKACVSGAIVSAQGDGRKKGTASDNAKNPRICGIYEFLSRHRVIKVPYSYFCTRDNVRLSHM